MTGQPPTVLLATMPGGHAKSVTNINEGTALVREKVM